mmetsp:Transcript_35752/g.99059  ORF Transcript_35752/g.99059 Transcript_35752/m.99059 type:complete len:100 (+) Transcript_35752:804-1103(+)
MGAHHEPVYRSSMYQKDTGQLENYENAACLESVEGSRSRYVFRGGAAIKAWDAGCTGKCTRGRPARCWRKYERKARCQELSTSRDETSVQEAIGAAEHV